MLSPKNMTVLKRALIGLIAISTVTLITLITIGWEVRNTIRNNGLERLEKILSHKLEQIGTYARHQYVALHTLNQLIFFVSRHHLIFEKSFWDNSPRLLRSNLAEFAEKNGFYDIFVITPSGDIIFTVKHESDFSTNLLEGPYRGTQLAQVFHAALRNAPPKISNYEFYTPSNDYAAFIAEPIIKNGKTVGVLAVQIDNRQIQKVINDYSELGKTGDVIAMFQYNSLPLIAAPLRFNKVEAFNPSGVSDILPIVNLLEGESGQCYLPRQDGDDLAAAWGYQNDFRMNVVVTIDQKELLQTWHRQAVSIFILFLIGVSIVIGMVVTLIRTFSHTIEKLTRYADQISKGDYVIDEEECSYDQEWQLLIRTFRKMSRDINQKVTQLNGQNIQLLKQKEEIEDLNRTLEDRIRIKSIQLRQYIDTVDKYVITSQTDKAGTIIYASEAFCKISGYTKEELIGKNHRIIRHPDMPDLFFDELWRTIQKGKIWQGEIKNLKADGGYYWVDTTISPDFEEGKVISYTAIRHDITDKKMVEELAITDPMTGLYNRRFYVKTMKEEMNRIKRHGSTLALMMVDVDHFKLYNDTYGHQEGDRVLSRIADVLKGYTSRSGEYAFRLGGEEFGVVLSGLNEAQYRELARRICKDTEALLIPHTKNTVSPYVTISIGIAVYYPDSTLTCEELYKQADKQLYSVKENGRNHVRI
ncbi:MAG: diguanylate cyclase [Sulfuricurvum sp.]|jgi:diguanylate cyclase (GGDEF)-like protein/PAS domain S-box-containing protein|uniref:sensor domain-containing diguanylate cyclase n=1 Tax=Sulfuricurvum sp. TaxID=2025608 RepID=UPI0025EA4B8B|nr:diguanylate cyclase [Sulfuricurvum sp.]MCK9372036.1 diguanylate cyclase [Sulfuricurvum sp.]